jgi:hypothetical protein
MNGVDIPNCSYFRYFQVMYQGLFRFRRYLLNDEIASLIIYGVDFFRRLVLE